MTALTDDMRRRILELMPRYPSKQAVTLPALHMVQDELRHVPLEAIREIAELLELRPSEVHDTMSFYQFFKDADHKLGRKRVWVCRSLSCALHGGEELLADLCRHKGVKPGQTAADGSVTMEYAECLGACEGAPCILVDDECHMNMTADRAKELMQSM